MTTRTAADAVDADRLLSDLRALRTFGAEGTGVRRTSLSPVDVASREWLVGRFAGAGLDARIDGLGTVVGRSGVGGRAVVLGSHTDTQPLGGWLDGAYGVVCGLEVARALPHLAIDVVSWMDEEGTFHGFVGSRAFARHDMSADLETMAGPLRDAGWWGRPVWQVEPDRHVGYLEAHIEQGGRLEATGSRLGVVTAIVGIRQHVVRFGGRRNHAGTTPMPMRADASVALVRFLTALDAAFDAARGPDSVWTHGRLSVGPGAPSIIPDSAEVTVQYRDPDAVVLARLDEAFARTVAGARASSPAGVTIDVAPSEYQVPPVEMDHGLAEVLAGAAAELAPGAWTRMPSGAAHDAQVVSEVLPSAMLFVPSIGGISHADDEDTDVADLVLGCRTLARAVEMLLDR
ncbi:MAG: hydantoinase/carbamoylase family amidase [Ilumatobacteraceae bacterium]